MFISNCPTIEPEELNNILSSSESFPAELLLLDVREPEEFSYTAIPNSHHIALGNIESEIQNLIDGHIDSKIVVICRVGQRSAMAANYLLSHGFKEVLNLRGGLLAYSKIDPNILCY